MSAARDFVGEASPAVEGSGVDFRNDKFAHM
jgi:hypothetical protein